MNGMKELIRNKWVAMEDTARRNKKLHSWLLVVIALLVAVLSFYGSTAKEEHATNTKTKKPMRKRPLCTCRKKRKKCQVSK